MCVVVMMIVIASQTSQGALSQQPECSYMQLINLADTMRQYTLSSCHDVIYELLLFLY